MTNATESFEAMLEGLRRAHPARLTLDERLALVCPRCGQRRVEAGVCTACGASKGNAT
jgi:ribosomal protein L32